MPQGGACVVPMSSAVRIGGGGGSRLSRRFALGMNLPP